MCRTRRRQCSRGHRRDCRMVSDRDGKRLERTRIISTYSAMHIPRWLWGGLCKCSRASRREKCIAGIRPSNGCCRAGNFRPMGTMWRRQGRPPTSRPWNALYSGQANPVKISDNAGCFSSAIPSQRAAGWHKPVEGLNFSSAPIHGRGLQILSLLRRERVGCVESKGSRHFPNRGGGLLRAIRSFL